MKCIFCEKNGKVTSVSHIVPESLGGRNSPVASSGVTCDACNQYFGQKVESKALKSFPFIGFRVLSGVKSKKGKAPSTLASGGKIISSGEYGKVVFEPFNDEMELKITSGQKTQFRIIAEVTESLSVCRMLLKMGLEQLGSHFYDVAISDRVNDARCFARGPQRGSSWWFILKSNPRELIGENPRQLELSIEIYELQGVLSSVMRLPGVTTITPLESHAIPPSSNELGEPEYRIIWGRC